jgi:hypothetical protein
MSQPAKSIQITRKQSVEVDKVNVLVIIGKEDQPYASRLAPMFASANVRVFASEIDSLHMLTTQCKERGIFNIVTTRVDVLVKLLPAGRVKKANISNYTGSVIAYNGVEFLIIQPLKQLVTVEYADWMMRHLLTKITRPQDWRKTSEFRWWALEKGSEFRDALAVLTKCDLIAVDTETVKEPRPAIELVQYTGFKFATNESWTYVVPMNNMAAY